ncbi:MAG TPA: hypothetical protein VHU91_02725, partial [Mycobacteriales bacterium]|nr:hypothetical protein [Mycobacteriales bacterium]
RATRGAGDTTSTEFTTRRDTKRKWTQHVDYWAVNGVFDKQGNQIRRPTVAYRNNVPAEDRTISYHEAAEQRAQREVRAVTRPHRTRNGKQAK